MECINAAAPTSVTLKDIKVGECFITNNILYIRTAPVKSLVHSTMVHEVLTRGDCFVCNLETGMLTVMKYSTPVTPVRVRSLYTVQSYSND